MTLDHSTTVVTAWYDIYDKGASCGWSEHMRDCALQLLSLCCPIVLFLDPADTEVRELTAGKANIRVVERSLNSFRTSSIVHASGVAVVVDHINPSKNTLEYIKLQNCKPELVGLAAEMNPFETSHFAWVDLCLRKVFRNEESMDLLAANLSNPTVAPILLIPGPWDLQDSRRCTFDQGPNWRFCGGLFLCDHSTALTFSSLCLSHLAQFIAQNGAVTWEVNFWAWLEHTGLLPSSFVWTYADHNDTMAASLRKTSK